MARQSEDELAVIQPKPDAGSSLRIMPEEQAREELQAQMALPMAENAVMRVKVLFPLPLFQAFDYLAPAEMGLSPGDWVAAPFGRNVFYGVVWPADAGENEEFDASKLKAVAEKVGAPPLAGEILDFLAWVAAYTMFPLGSVLRLSMRSGEALAPPQGLFGYRASGAAPDRMTEAGRAALANAIVYMRDFDGQAPTRRAGVRARGEWRDILDSPYVEGVELPRYFADTGRVQDLESRLVSCMATLQGFDAAEIAKTAFGKGEMANVTALATWIAAQSRGMRFALPTAHPEEKRFVELGKRAFFYRAGPHDFACATCHAVDGQRIRLQDLPNLTKNPGDGIGFAAWPAYRVSNGQMWSMQLRLNDCYRQQRFPYPGFGSDVTIALGSYMGVNARGAESIVPAIKR